MKKIISAKILPCITWREESPFPCITPNGEHHPQSPAAKSLQLEALEALRDRILFELKLGKQATGYKVALKALNGERKILGEIGTGSPVR